MCRDSSLQWQRERLCVTAFSVESPSCALLYVYFSNHAVSLSSNTPHIVSMYTSQCEADKACCCSRSKSWWYRVVETTATRLTPVRTITEEGIMNIIIVEEVAIKEHQKSLESNRTSRQAIQFEQFGRYLISKWVSSDMHTHSLPMFGVQLLKHNFDSKRIYWQAVIKCFQVTCSLLVIDPSTSRLVQLFFYIWLQERRKLRSYSMPGAVAKLIVLFPDTAS